MQTLVCFCFKIFFCERKDLTTGNDTFGLKLNRVNGHHILLWQPPNLSSFMLRMVSCRWQLNCITYAHVVPRISVLWARNSRCGSEQHFLEDTPCTWHSPSPLHWEPEPQPSARPSMAHFRLWYWSTGREHYLWGWRHPPSHAEMAHCFHFTTRLSPFILLIQMLLFMLPWEANISDMNW